MSSRKERSEWVGDRKGVDRGPEGRRSVKGRRSVTYAISEVVNFAPQAKKFRVISAKVVHFAPQAKKKWDKNGVLRGVNGVFAPQAKILK